MMLLRWLWIGNGNDGEIPPIAVFWTLRVLMFIISFVLEDWAIHELVQSTRHRRVAVLLVASSYVTWTYQTHTFSNSVETLVVAWCLVLIERIVESPVCWLRSYSPTKLTISALATELVLGLNCSWHRCGVRRFQPHYFPSFPLDTGASVAPVLHKEVGAPAK